MVHRTILAMIVGTSAVAAIAQTAPVPGPIERANYLAVMDKEFRGVDSSKDGVVTKQEIENYQRAAALNELAARNRTVFAKLDADKDGKLTPGEFAKLIQPVQASAQPMLNDYDANRDGKVSQIEFRTVKLSRFDAVDIDKDGVVSLAEQRAAGLIK